MSGVSYSLNVESPPYSLGIESPQHAPPHYQQRLLIAGNRNLLEDSILDIIDGISFQDTNKTHRRVAQVACILISATAKIPYIPINLQIPYIGPASAVGNCLGFFKFEVWAGFSLIDDVAGPKGENEKLLLARNKRNQCVTVITTIGSCIFAALSQVPPSLAAYNYNDPQYKVAAAIGTDLSGAFFPALSVERSIQQFLKLRSYNEFGKKLHAIRLDMVSLIKEHWDLFVQMGMDSKLILVREFNYLRTVQLATQKINAFVLKMLTKPRGNQFQAHAPTKCDRAVKYISMAVGGVLTASMQTALCWYTFVNMKKISNENGWPSFFTVTTYLANTYLMTTLLLKTNEQLFNFLRGKKSSMADHLRPQLTFALKSIALILDICALGPTWKIWGDFDAEETNDSHYFQATMMASIFLLLFSATLSVIDDCVEYALKHKGTELEKQILGLRDDFKKVCNLMVDCGLLDFCLFFSDCDDDIKQLFMEKHGLTPLALQEGCELIQS